MSSGHDSLGDWRQHELIPLSLRERDVLDGLMLGDGCLFLGQHSANPCLTVSRQIADHEYNVWTADVFSGRLTALSISTRNIHDSRTDKIYAQSRFRSRCDPALLPYYQRWYPTKVKVVPQNLSLSRTTVAVWFADDGGVRQTSKRSIELKFSTQGFTEDSVYLLSSLLTARYNGPFPVYKAGKVGQFIVRAFGQAAKDLITDIDVDFPPVSRKSDLWRLSGVLSKKPQAPSCIYCNSTKVYFYGHTPKGEQKYKCTVCLKNFRDSLIPTLE